MQVYKKIPVTMDCSPVDAAIVAHVSALARQNKAEVHLLHVVHSHTLDQDRAQQTLAKTALVAHRQHLQDMGIKVHVIIRNGKPDTEILHQIAENNYDLVAMVSRNWTGHRRLCYLSPTHYLTHAHWPGRIRFVPTQVPIICHPGPRCPRP